MAANTARAIKAISGNTLKPRPQELTPIATDIFLPNLSGVTSDPKITNAFDDRYVNVTGDTMTGSSRIYFRDTGLSIFSSADGVLQIDSDTQISWSIGGTAYLTMTASTLGTNSISPVDLGSSLAPFDDFYSSGISYQSHAASQPARSLDTVYQNTTGHPIIVYGSVAVGTDFTFEPSSYTAYVLCKTDSAATPTTVVQKVGADSDSGVHTGTRNHGFYMVVQNNHYYWLDKVTSDGVVTLGYWNEVNF